MRLALDLSGQRFGRLIAQNPTMQRSNGSVVWRTTCDCNGSDHYVSASNLKTGAVQSCGCLKVDVIRQEKTKHGASVKQQKHPLYKAWQHRKDRCYNVNNAYYKDYGGRGITMYAPWIDDYPAFRDYVMALPNCPDNVQVPGAKLDRELDRYPDNDGPYAPGNLRWATRTEQMGNMSSNRTIRVNGVALCLSEAVRRHAKVSLTTVKSRLARNWPIEKAFLEPARPKRQ